MPRPVSLFDKAKALNEALKNPQTELITTDKIAKVVIRKLENALNERTLHPLEETLKRKLEAAMQSGVDADTLDTFYLELGVRESKEDLSVVGKKYQKIAEQRRKIREIKSKKGMTQKEWKEENEKLERLVKHLDVYDDVLIREQMEEVECLHARYRIPKNHRATSFESDDLVPKERVLIHLFNIPGQNEPLGRFLLYNFDMDEFAVFREKLQTRVQMDVDNTLELPEPSASNGEEIDHRRVSKRAFLDDIALRIIQWRESFLALSLPIPTWPGGIPRMFYNSKERDLIDSIASGLSPYFDRTAEDALTLFSFRELEELSFKVDYRIRVMTDLLALPNIDEPEQKSVADKNGVEDLSETPNEKKEGYVDCLYDWERFERLRLAELLIDRIREPKIPEMSMFILQPDIAELFDADEKFMIVHYYLGFHGDKSTLMFPLAWIIKFHRQLDGIELRLKNEMKKKGKSQKFWFPKTPRDLIRRDKEDKVLIECMLLMIINKRYDKVDPLQRIEFNKDFRYVFSNREIMLKHQGALTNGDVLTFDYEKSSVFFEKFCESKESVVEKWRGYSYEEVVKRSILFNRLRRMRYEGMVNREESDPVRRAARMRRLLEDVRTKEEDEQDEVVQLFNEPAPPRSNEYDLHFDSNKHVVYTNHIKLPHKLPKVAADPIQRKINRKDPIRVARRQWKKRRTLVTLRINLTESNVM